jgi:uncharacterized protein YjbJ (UPF0337 family)
MWNSDELKGKGKQIKGDIKDKVGEFTNNRDLEAEGEAEHAEGTIQEGVGTARRKVGDVVKDIGDKVAGRG